MSSPTHASWRLDRPAEGFYSTELPSRPTAAVRTFMPDGYEPRYPYPLLVMFHGRGGNEEQVLRLAPRMSRRNFLSVSMRGPELLGSRTDGRPACGWGEGADEGAIDDYLIDTVEQTRRTYHIHSERVYLVGVCEGAAVAYRAAFALAGKVAGVISLNGAMPKPTPGVPMFRYDAVRGLRVMIGHGIANSVIPYTSAERDRQLLYTAGADVKLNPYPATHKLHSDMLRDVNRWVIGHVNAAYQGELVATR